MTRIYILYAAVSLAVVWAIGYSLMGGDTLLAVWQAATLTATTAWVAAEQRLIHKGDR